MLEETILSIPIEKLEFSAVDDNNKAKAKLYVMHEDLNYNESVIPMSAIENAESTISNIPILAYVKKDEETNEASDFAGHELKQDLVAENGELVFKTTYLEQPIGVIPETNDYHYETINGQQWVVINGYIWKSYSNEAYDLLESAKTKGISMEIKVLDGMVDKNTGFYIINKFEYLGITVLGDDITPAMGNEAKIKLYSTENKKQYFSMCKKLNEELKIEIEKEVKGLSMEVSEFEKCKDKEKDIEKMKCHENEEQGKEKHSCKDEEKDMEKHSCKDEEKDKEKHEKKTDDSESENTNGLNVKAEIKQIDEDEMMSKCDKKDVEKHSCKDEEKGKEKHSCEDGSDSCEDEENLKENEAVLNEDRDKEECYSKNKEITEPTVSLSINYIIEQINSQLDKVREEVEAWWSEDGVETLPKYMMVDLLVDKKIVIVTNFDNEFFGIPYVIQGDEVILEMADIKPYISSWKEKETNSELKFESKRKSSIKKMIEESKKAYDELEDKYEKVSEKCEELKEFKYEIDKKTRFIEIDNLIGEFNFSDDEIKTLREKAYSEEISMETLKKELYALEGMRVHKAKEVYSTSKKNLVLGYSINSNKVSKKSKYGEASIYFNK